VSHTPDNNETVEEAAENTSKDTPSSPKKISFHKTFASLPFTKIIVQ
jgi:hypothetical protein